MRKEEEEEEGNDVLEGVDGWGYNFIHGSMHANGVGYPVWRRFCEVFRELQKIYKGSTVISAK